MRWLIASVLVVSVAALLAARQGASGQGGATFGGGYIDPELFGWDGQAEAEASAPSEEMLEADQTNTWIEEAMNNLNPSNLAAPLVPAEYADRNIAAFLTMIAKAEGTELAGGYSCMFGSTPSRPRLLDSFADHPRVYTPFTDGAGRTLRSSAAGRYQFIVATWDSLAKKLGLPDFGPASQDRAAIELIRQKGALNDVRAGRVASAVAKCAPIWASFPGAGYAQPERQISYLLSAYDYAGGVREA